MYICICEQVTDRQIKAAINQGAASLRDLRNELGVASQCGQCGRCAKALLMEHTAKSTHPLPQPKKTRSPTSTDIFPLFGGTLFAGD